MTTIEYDTCIPVIDRHVDVSQKAPVRPLPLEDRPAAEELERRVREDRKQ
jgi:hypothetical protein